jgi:predicted acyl esterase
VVTILKSRTPPLEEGKYPGFKPEVVSHQAFDLHRDVAVKLRDGVTIYIDIYMPKDLSRPVPAIIGWSPYGKHGYKSLAMMPGADVDPSWISRFAIWEGADPVHWCPRGYAIVSPDCRGAWASEGELTFWSHQEALDGYDVIEWLATQSWCNGKVGMLGVSYLAISQWSIASKCPPHLAAICPWEGLSDPYRELLFHGGIPEQYFAGWWREKSRFSLREVEDFTLMQQSNPTFDAYWASKISDFAAIGVPAFVVASWTDQGCHTRGTLEAFRGLGSKDKWLMIHGDKKWKHFYHPENVAKQVAFFDTYLKGATGLLDRWPKVEMEVRETGGTSRKVSAESWPVPGTQYRTLFLDGASGGMTAGLPTAPASAAYLSESPGERLTFDIRFDEDLSIVGYSKVKLWVSTAEATEMDIFVALEKLDADGRRIPVYFFCYFDEGPLALGWLRASHRELDPEQSTAFQPYHTHRNPQPLTPGTIYPVEIEIWPSGTHFRKGDTLRLVVQGTDVQHFDTGAVEVLHKPNNKGLNFVHTGGRHDSHLLIPVLGKKSRG